MAITAANLDSHDMYAFSFLSRQNFLADSIDIPVAMPMIPCWRNLFNHQIGRLTKMNTMFF